MPAEPTQEQGRRGVALTKRWLEASTFIELPWNIYENPPMCEVELLGGRIKRFDLAGLFLTENRQPVLVENKSYNGEHGQKSEYREFLANAYSASARQLAAGRTDDQREFIWVTSHPFGPMTHWNRLESERHMRDGIADYPDALDGGAIDDDLIRRVASRIWVLVLNPKQERISMNADELSIVQHALKRKESTL